MAISALGIGSGMDLNGLLDQLKSAERQKLQPFVEQRKSFEAKISAYGRLEGAIDGFRSAAAKLNDPDLFVSTTSSVDGDAVKSAASSGASVGEYSINVTQMARAYSVATAAIADKTASLGAGTVDLTLGNGSTFSVAIAAESSSLENVRDAINAKDAGVSASIVNDGNGYRLAFASTTTGTDAAVTSLTFGADLGTSLTLDATTEVTARNAQLTVNNIAVESQTNQVEGAIEGVTLSIQQTGSATLTVASDADGITKAVENFVTAYNTLQSRVDMLTRFDAATGDAGTLLGDATMRNIQSYLRTTMSDAGGGTFKLLSDIGISLQLDGSLELDKEKLSGIVKAQSPALSDFLAGAGTADGFTDRLDATLEQVLKDDGILDTATEGLEASVERVNDRYASMEVSIESTISRYRKQFAQLDSIVATMNSTSGYLAQQFDMMNAQLGRK